MRLFSSVDEIHNAVFSAEDGELPDRLSVGAAVFGLRMCELKKSRVRVRAFDRAVKIEGREAWIWTRLFMRAGPQ
jgi:hypothetical protein